MPYWASRLWPTCRGGASGRASPQPFPVGTRSGVVVGFGSIRTTPAFRAVLASAAATNPGRTFLMFMGSRLAGMDHLDAEMVRAPPGTFGGLKYREKGAESIGVRPDGRAATHAFFLPQF